MTGLSSLSRLELSLAAITLGVLAAIAGLVFASQSISLAGAALAGLGVIAAWLSARHARRSLARLAYVSEAAANGNLEERIVLLGDGGEMAALARNLNHLLDMSDAFVREAVASLSCVQAGAFHRRIVERGMHGSYRDAAMVMNTAVIAMDNRFSEFSALIESCEATAGRVVGHVKIAAGDLQTSSGEMLRATQASETDMTRIGASANATTHDVTTVASAAEQLAITARSIEEQVERSRSLNEKAVDQVHATRKAVNSLSAATSEIGPIADLIRAVADQTRLLALNATIEAARAGEHGRSFAVVAGEVKALADQTASASEKIVERIRVIEATAESSTQTIESFARTVEEVTAIAGTISSSVIQQVSSTAEISRAIGQTATRTDDVTSKVDGVLGAIQHTSSQAQGLYSSAEKLGTEASLLDRELKDFLSSARRLAGKAA
jgi:methyl-accepting chemotaxis protein